MAESGWQAWLGARALRRIAARLAGKTTNPSLTAADTLTARDAPTDRSRRRTLWLVGTSMSIESGGYVDSLVPQADRSGIDVINLSVGDQTSVMGCMRVFAEQARFRSGDVVVWEYSLLDHLLGEDSFSMDDTTQARRMAWSILRRSGVGIVVLLCAPRDQLSARTQAELLVAADAALLGIECIDIRELFRQADIGNPVEHFRDDRHLRIDSPMIAVLAQRVLRSVHSVVLNGRVMTLPVPTWRWLDLSHAADESAQCRDYANSLMDVRARVLAVGEILSLPDTRRVVALGIVSTAESGAVWCGHPECPPAATRMPPDLHYPFLLRTTGIPCARAQIQLLMSAPDWAFRNGFWRAYGHALSATPGPISVFGALIESAD